MFDRRGHYIKSVAYHCWTKQRFSINCYVTIGAALGDLQCSVLATMQKPHDAVLNLSTSAQLAFVMPPHFEPNKQPGMTISLEVLFKI